MSYDETERRDTPLALAFKERLRRDKWMLVGEYVWLCLDDDTYGYYRNRPAIGSGGDFVTAPEISQTFGELIGLWCAVVWQQMGCPPKLRVVEIGPGRGTMMRDALRAMGSVPGLMDALEIALIDVDQPLIEAQRESLKSVVPKITWYSKFNDIGAGSPTLVLANEYLDTRGVNQYILVENSLRERTVELDANGQFVFGIDPRLHTWFDATQLRSDFPDARDGDIFESQPNYEPTHLERLCESAPMAALFIDYGQMGHGHVSKGDTLQAVRNHRYEHIFTSPGEADLSTQVNFTGFAQNALDLELQVDGPTTQAEFLGRLGIMERASKLMAANPERAGEIEAGVMRLMAPNGMGTRFKAIGIRSLDVPKLPGF